MMNIGFTLALELVLALLLAWAAVSDACRYIIPNRISLAIAVLAPLSWWAGALPLWPDCAAQLGVAMLVFAGFAILFQLGVMGGGDVKLATAIALWLSPEETLRFLVWMSLLGAAITLGVVALHRLRRSSQKPEVPYGVAIALGALAILAERFLNQFA